MVCSRSCRWNECRSQVLPAWKLALGVLLEGDLNFKSGGKQLQVLIVKEKVV